MLRIAPLALLLVGLALPRVSLAQQPLDAHLSRQPVEVASGQDLVAWQSLEHLRLEGAAAVQAYRAFVLDYPTSPLAVVAWSRLVELGAGTVDEREERVRKQLAAVRDRWRHVVEVSARAAHEAEVAPIDLRY